MSLKLTAILTFLLSPLLFLLNARMAQLPQINVNGRNVELSPVEVPPNAPMAVLLPQLEEETNKALTAMTAFNQAGAALLNRTNTLFGLTRGSMEAEAAAARETNRQLAQELEHQRALSHGLQQDLNIS